MAEAVRGTEHDDVFIFRLAGAVFAEIHTHFRDVVEAAKGEEGERGGGGFEVAG